MKTPLDAGHIWFLDKLEYNGELRIYVVEGIVDENETMVEITSEISFSARQVRVKDSSKMYCIVFEHIYAYRQIDESGYLPFDGEITGRQPIIEQPGGTVSEYVKIEGKFPFGSIWSEYKHFSIGLADDVIHVIANSYPTVVTI